MTELRLRATPTASDVHALLDQLQRWLPGGDRNARLQTLFFCKQCGAAPGHPCVRGSEPAPRLHAARQWRYLRMSYATVDAWRSDVADYGPEAVMRSIVRSSLFRGLRRAGYL